jgi:hypothetical protein
LKNGAEAADGSSTLKSNEMLNQHFIAELVDEMDLYRAGRNEPSLQHFIDDFRKVTILVKKE